MAVSLWNKKSLNDIYNRHGYSNWIVIKHLLDFIDF